MFSYPCFLFRYCFSVPMQCWKWNGDCYSQKCENWKEKWAQNSEFPCRANYTWSLDKHLDCVSKGILTNTSIAPRKGCWQTSRLRLERNLDKHLDSTSKGISTNTSIAPRKESRQTPRLHLDCTSKGTLTNISIASRKKSRQTPQLHLKRNLDSRSKTYRQHVENISTTCHKKVREHVEKISTTCRKKSRERVDKNSITRRQDLDNMSTRSREHVDKISRTCRRDLDNMSNRNSKFLRITLSRMNEKVLHRSLEGVIKYGLESDWSK